MMSPRCSIIGCGPSYRSKEPKVTLHRLPNNDVLKNKWLEALIGNEITSDVNSIFICSRHFEDSCFNRTLSVVRLREDAVPTIFDSKPAVKKGVKRNYNGDTANLNNPQVRLVDCTKSTLAKTNMLHVKEEISDYEGDNNDNDGDNNDDDYDYKADKADDHDTESAGSRSPVQKKSYRYKKSPEHVPVMECSEEEVSAPAPVRSISVDPLQIKKRKRQRYTTPDERTARLIQKLKEKNLDRQREIKRLNQKIRRQVQTITKLRAPNGLYKDSVDVSSSSNPIVIGYVCDDVTEKCASSDTPDKTKYLDKKDLKLRRVNNVYENPVYEFVNDEADSGKKEDKQNTDSLSKIDKKARKLDSEYWKLKLSYILHKTQFCGLCLNSSDELNAVTDELEMIINGVTHKRTLVDIVENTFKDAQDVWSNSKICNNCKTSLIESYIFIENIKHMSKVLNYHLTELYSKACYIQNTVLNDSEHRNIRNVVFSLETTDHSTVDTAVKTDNDQQETGTIDEKADFFKCMKCNISLSSYKQWKKHKETHKNNENKCRICNSIFKTSELLAKHFTEHFKAKCRICNGLVQDGGLLTHLKMCHKSSIHLCTKCDVVFYTSVALEAHNALWHSTGGYVCLTCRRSFAGEELAIHKCRFACPDRDCGGPPCVHHKYLMSYREQVLSLAPRAKCPDCHYVTSSMGRFISHANNTHLHKVGRVKERA